MDRNLTALKPALVWKHVAEIVRSPRPSHHEEAIRRYVLDFARSLGLEASEDEAHNVLVRKPASKGMENRKGVILQAHLDMVPQKNNDKTFDFLTDPIDAYIDGEWVTAYGTTLGADNGIGVAAILAVLAPILLVVLRQGNRSPEFRQLWNDSKFNRGPLVSLILIKCLLCIGILMTVVASLFDTASGMGFAVSLALLTGIVFSKRLRRRSFEMEERLRENFGGDDTADAERPLNEGQLPFRNQDRATPFSCG